MMILALGNFANWIEHILITIIAFVITWLVSRILINGIIGKLEEISLKSEVTWDDVLVPVIERIISTIVWIIGILISLEFWGFDLSWLYIVLCCCVLVLGFVFRDILSNIFSGLVLLLDSPFQFGDVVRLEDGKIAVVKNIGLRVTHLYNIGEHSDIFMPNAVLGRANIVNITRPTTDSLVSVIVGVGYSSDIKKTSSILEKIINGHPDVLGNIPVKTALISEFGEISVEKKKASLERLNAEQKVTEKLEEVETELLILANLLPKMNGKDIDKLAKEELKKQYEKIAKNLGLGFVQESKKTFIQTRRKMVENRDQNTLFNRVKHWVAIWESDPDLAVEDKGAEGVLSKEWDRKLIFLDGRVKRFFQCITNLSSRERKLDTDIQNLIEWIHLNFKESHCLWKEPDVRLVNFGASSLDFEIRFYVDNIKLEHYERVDRVKDELRREIVRRFNENQIEIPFPQVDVWFRSSIAPK